MERTTRSRRVATLTAAVVAAWLGACATPPGGSPTPAPAPPKPATGPVHAPDAGRAPEAPAPAPAAEPASPASPVSAQQAQRQATAAVELLEVGNEEQALVEIQRALQADPSNRLAQSLLKQIQTDPQVLLGREHFSYRVEPGESLSRIAGRFLKDIHLFYALARYNDIKVPRQLQGGQVIKVPGRQPPPAPAPAPSPSPPPPPPAAPPPPPPTPAPAPPPAPPAELVVAQEYRRGLALMAAQKPVEAIAAFDAVLEKDANHANAKLKRAQALSQVVGLIRLYDNQIRQLDAELATNPGNADAKARRAKAVAERTKLQAVK